MQDDRGVSPAAVRQALALWQIQESASAAVPEENVLVCDYLFQIRKARTLPQWQTTVRKVCNMDPAAVEQLGPKDALFDHLVAEVPPFQ